MPPLRDGIDNWRVKSSGGAAEEMLSRYLARKVLQTGRAVSWFSPLEIFREKGQAINEESNRSRDDKSLAQDRQPLVRSRSDVDAGTA